MIFTTAEINTIFNFTYQKYKVYFLVIYSTYVYEYGENSYYFWSKIIRTKYYKIITKVTDITEDITHASVIIYQSLDNKAANELMKKLWQLLPQLDITQYNNRVFENACKGISKGSAL